MKRLFQAYVPAFVLTLCSVITPASGSEKILFNGQDPDSNKGITAKSWGSGTIALTSDQQREGKGVSYKLSARDFYQGGRILFSDPVDLSQVAADANAYLAITLRRGSETTVTVSETMPADAPGAALPNPDGTGGMPGTVSKTAPFKKMRVFLGGDKKGIELVSYDILSITDWQTIGIPLDLFIKSENTRLSEIIIGTDSPATVYISNIMAVNDTTDINAKIRTEKYNEIKANTDVEFVGEATGGLSPLRYSWDFDTKDANAEDKTGIMKDRATELTDGVQVRVKHKFEKPGRYTIKLTVSPDDASTKKAVEETVEVEVVP